MIYNKCAFFNSILLIISYKIETLQVLKICIQVEYAQALRGKVREMLEAVSAVFLTY